MLNLKSIVAVNKTLNNDDGRGHFNCTIACSRFNAAHLLHCIFYSVCTLLCYLMPSMGLFLFYSSCA